MSDLYSELIIKRKTPLIEQVIKSLMIAATAALGFLYLMTIKWTFLIALVIMAAADYFLFRDLIWNMNICMSMGNWTLIRLWQSQGERKSAVLI